MKSIKILLGFLVLVMVIMFIPEAKAGDGCMIVTDEHGSYEICPKGPGGGPAPEPAPKDPDEEEQIFDIGPIEQVAHSTDYSTSVACTPTTCRGCDADGKNCTHRCKLSGECKPIPKPKEEFTSRLY